MGTTKSALEVLEAFTSTFIKQQLCRYQEDALRNLYKIIKISDFYAELSRSNFAGERKSSWDEFLSITFGAAIMLPKLLTHCHSFSQLRNKQPNAVPDPYIVLTRIGALMNFKRLATGEKYGMTKCSVHSPEIVEINLVGDNLERLEHADRNALLEAERNDRNLARLAIENAESDLLQKTLNVRGYTDSTQEFEDLRKIFRLRARLNMPVYAEADEFANKTQIGPLQFRDWKKIAINLCAIGATKAHLEDRSLARSGKLTKINFLENPPILISKEELGKH